MTNTVLQQPTEVSLQLTDYLLGYQAGQSPPTRKVSVSALDAYYALLTGATYTGAVTISSGGLTVSANGITVTGTSSFASAVTVQAAAAASQQPLRADQSWQTIATYTPSGAASQAFPLSSSFRRFRLTLQGVTVNTNGAKLQLQFSADGGSTYKASGYGATLWQVHSDNTSEANGSLATTGITITTALFVPTGATSVDATAEIYPGTVALRAKARGQTACVNTSTTLDNVSFVGEWLTAGLMDFCRLIPTSGTVSGTLILEGLP